MFGLFNKKTYQPTVTPEDKEWVERNIIWFIEVFGLDKLKEQPFIFPTVENFLYNNLKDTDQSVLDSLILNNGLKKIHVVYYWLGKQNHPDLSLLRADYVGESKKEMYASGKSSITVYGVKSTDNDENIILAAREGIESVIKWLTELENSGNVVRAKDHSILIYWKNERLAVEKK